MSEVVQFVKRDKSESPDVVAFKTDLKIFTNYLDSINIQQSRWAMTTVSLDQTSVNFVSNFMDNLLEHIKKFCQDVMTSKYKSVALINQSLYGSVMDYLDWSELNDNPIFEFAIATGCYDLTFTTVKLNNSETLITNISYDGLPIVGRLVSCIATLLNTNPQLTGGGAGIPEIEGSPLNFGLYGYTFNRPEEEELKPTPITEGLRKDDLLDYLSDNLYGDDFILLPMEVEYFSIDHPELDKPVAIFPHGDLYIPGILPMTLMDRQMKFKCFTADEIIMIAWDEKEEVWQIKLDGKRENKPFLDFIQTKMNSVDLAGAVWNMEGDSYWYAIPFNYLGNEGQIRWDRVGAKGATAVVATIVNAPCTEAEFNLRTVTTGTCITSILDANTGLLSDIFDGINDYIE